MKLAIRILTILTTISICSESLLFAQDLTIDKAIDYYDHGIHDTALNQFIEIYHDPQSDGGKKSYALFYMAMISFDRQDYQQAYIDLKKIELLYSNAEIASEAKEFAGRIYQLAVVLSKDSYEVKYEDFTLPKIQTKAMDLIGPVIPYVRKRTLEGEVTYTMHFDYKIMGDEIPIVRTEVLTEYDLEEILDAVEAQNNSIENDKSSNANQLERTWFFTKKGLQTTYKIDLDSKFNTVYPFLNGVELREFNQLLTTFVQARLIIQAQKGK